jgi:SAM-dependent methyltransferase
VTRSAAADQALLDALRSLQPSVEAALLDGLSAQFDEGAWSSFEHDCSLDDLLELGKGGDACYDRPSSGFAYAIWYQPRRIQTALRLLTSELLSRPNDQPLVIVDLGCGTGAVAWALGLLGVAARSMGMRVPSTELIGVDSSSPMLDTADRLWTTFESHFGGGNGLKVDWQLRNWATLPGPKALGLASGVEPLLVGSYLFDHSEVPLARTTGQNLARTARKLSARRVLLCGPATKSVKDALSDGMGDDWTDSPAESSKAVFRGPLASLGSLRERASALVGAGKGLTSSPAWQSGEKPIFRCFDLNGASGRLFAEERRSEFVLDDLQDDVANRPGGPTAVIGPAGSGKSRVLVERVARRVERAPAAERIEVLVTTFNKAMAAQLADWLEERLCSPTGSAWTRTGWDFVALGPLPRTVRVANWDRVLGMLFPGLPKGSSIVEKTVLKDLEAHGIDPEVLTATQKRVLDHRFLEAELARYVFGKGCWSDRDAYMSLRRLGAEVRLGPEHKRLVWQVGREGSTVTWTHRRARAHERARESAAEQPPAFTDVFVDECQDMTVADFELISLMVPDPERITVAGDEAQSFRLGNSYMRPGRLYVHPTTRERVGVGFRLWSNNVFHLPASYRMPRRLCEAVEPLAAHVRDLHRSGKPGADAEDGDEPDEDLTDDVGIPGPRSEAVLGIRPVVVRIDELGDALGALLRTHRRLVDQLPPDRRRLLVPDGSGPSIRSVRSRLPSGWQIDTDNVFTSKGLEWPIVIWHSGLSGDTHEADLEWIYTSMTRATTMLFVVVDDGAGPMAREAARLLRRDRLMFWSEDSQEMLDGW